MFTRRIILGLEGAGGYLKMYLRNIGVSDERITQPDGTRSVLEFVYKQCAEQTIMAYNPDPRVFMTRLGFMPDIAFFRHIDPIMNPVNSVPFKEAFTEFAMRVYFEINRILKIRMDVDYLLESIGDDFIVLNEHTKDE